MSLNLLCVFNSDDKKLKKSWLLHGKTPAVKATPPSRGLMMPTHIMPHWVNPWWKGKVKRIGSKPGCGSFQSFHRVKKKKRERNHSVTQRMAWGQVGTDETRIQRGKTYGIMMRAKFIFEHHLLAPWPFKSDNKKKRERKKCHRKDHYSLHPCCRWGKKELFVIGKKSDPPLLQKCVHTACRYAARLTGNLFEERTRE